MLRKLAAVIVAALTLFVATSAHADVTIRGAHSCGEWMEAHRSSDPSIRSVVAERWVVGYFSGMAIVSGKDILKGTDNASIFLWITNYCRANPLSDTADASTTLSLELIKRKGL